MKHLLAFCLAFVGVANAITAIVAGSNGKAVHPLQYGLMLGDINYSGDGVMPEPRFQGTSSVYPWAAVGGATLTFGNASLALSEALHKSVAVRGGANAAIGPSNPSFWRIEYSGSFTAQRKGSSGTGYATTTIPSTSKSGSWAKRNFILSPISATPDTLHFNLISLFPPTYKNCPNGMRTELMEALKALNPSFLRLRGGNNIEGDKSPNRWKWSIWIWNQFLLSLARLYLDKTTVSKSTLEPLVTDALNTLETLMGNSSTTYGKQRIALSYPDLSPIKYVEPDKATLDVHEYNTTNTFASEFNTFDNVSTLYKVLISEYAANKLFAGYPWCIGAVLKPYTRLGGDKIAVKVIGFYYTPMLQNINSQQWHPDLISFTADTGKTALSMSYQQIKLFSTNRMTAATVYNTRSSVPFQLTFPGTATGATAQLTVLTAPNAYSIVTPGSANPVKWDVQTITATGSRFSFSLLQWSIYIIS
ncbi:glycoside hydrolase family 51 protein [Zopfia rhizophila CBS 207.26]|uniref:Glycoside hydrolase family 51 protein n=1 Tax=Zopfia rhizophila CBS 207.26 TaxID=1314779 RepID=A0A6A6DI03_9PEZI|nr:glycoside hydrolase family 51 protein [Zopfia rhizophila CBS 207.26]